MLLVGDAGIRLRPVADKFTADADDEISRGMPGVAKKAAGFFAAAFAAVSIGKFLTDAIGQASDLGENLSKVGVVFGPASAQIEAFASTASTALGQSRNQALEAAGSFGSLFVGMGIGQQQAADMSTQMVTLASDMASFGNATPQEALDALRSGLVGEAEPLRRFGVMLNSASIEQEAMRLGLMQAGGELTEAAKAQAVYSLAIQQTGIQQGDFGRTSEGLANQQRILKAQFTDLQTNIGGFFVPMLANLAGLITGGVMPAFLRWTGGLEPLGQALGRIGDVFRIGFTDGNAAVNTATEGVDGLAFKVLQFSGFVGDLAAIFREAFVDGAAGSALMAENSFQGVAATLGAVAGWIRITIGPALLELQSMIGPALSAIGDAFGAAFSGGGGAGGALSGFSALVAQVGPMIAGYITRWADVFAALIPIIVDVLSGLAPVIASVVGLIGPLLSTLLPVFTEIATAISGTIVSVLGQITPIIPPLVAMIGQLVQILAGGFLQVIQAIAPAIPPIVSALGQVVTVLAGGFMQVLTALMPVIPVLVSALADIALVLAGALSSALQAVAPVLPQLADAISRVAVALAGAFADALGAILPVLPPLIDALVTLVTTALGALLPILPLVAELIASLVEAVAPVLPAIASLIGQLISLAVQALQPFLPMLPMISGLLLRLVQAFMPIIPPVMEIIGVLIDLAIQAMTPLMPVITLLVGLIAQLVPVLIPIIGVVLNVAGVLIGTWFSVVGAVVGFVSTIVQKIGELIGWFIGLPGRILGAIGDFGRLLFDKGAQLIQGLVDGIASAAQFVGNIGRNIVNAVIGFINSAIIDGINDLMEFTIPVPGLPDIHIDPPNIPRIPRLHSGGVYDSGTFRGEGLAVLRDDETVVTPEERDRMAAVLAAVGGASRLPTLGAAAGIDGAGITINEHVYQQPGEPVGSVAARVTQGVVWNLNNGITRRVGAAAGAPA